MDDCNPSQDWQTLASPLATARNIPYLQTPRNLREVFAMILHMYSGHTMLFSVHSLSVPSKFASTSVTSETHIK